MPTKTVSAQTEIDITAPVEAVWRVMLDLGAYGEWNSFIFHVSGAVEKPALGSKLLLHVRWADGGETTSAEQITVIEPPEATPGQPRRAALAYRFTGWLARLGLVRATRYQTLEELPGGGTQYWTEERFSGLLARFVPMGKVQEGFERQARALKERCST